MFFIFIITQKKLLLKNKFCQYTKFIQELVALFQSLKPQPKNLTRPRRLALAGEQQKI